MKHKQDSNIVPAAIFTTFICGVVLFFVMVTQSIRTVHLGGNYYTILRAEKYVNGGKASITFHDTHSLRQMPYILERVRNEARNRRDELLMAFL